MRVVAELIRITLNFSSIFGKACDFHITTLTRDFGVAALFALPKARKPPLAMPPSDHYGMQEMHVGDQDVAITTSNLQYLARNGVAHIDSFIGGGNNAKGMALGGGGDP